MPNEIVIWLEIHLKLNSVNKLFCQCPNVQNFDDLEPNTNVCPVCTGQPWALPVLNQEALNKAVHLWLALDCHIERISTFDRKSYFYPDLPMGYQITQQLKPTCIDGNVQYFVDKEFEVLKEARIRDAHIETDTGKSTRVDGSVYLDYNRSATPLVEIVTHPDLRSSEEVVAFLKELQRRAQYNWISDAELEKWQMRVDVNISLRPEGSETFGTRVELKNMNSYSAIERAIAHEVARQEELGPDNVEQQTRAWDDAAKDSHCMRSKEDAMDYRFMPEPDMPAVKIHDDELDVLRKGVTEHPTTRIMRYKNEYGFNKEYINGLIGDVAMNTYFEACAAQGCSPAETAKWLVWPVARWLNENEKRMTDVAFKKEAFISFLNMIAEWSLASAQAKIVIKEMILTGKAPATIVEEKWLKPVDESTVRGWLEEVFTAKPDVLEDLKSWNMKPMWFVIGQVMQKSQGSGDPQMVQKVLKEMIGQ